MNLQAIGRPVIESIIKSEHAFLPSPVLNRVKTFIENLIPKYEPVGPKAVESRAKSKFGLEFD